LRMSPPGTKPTSRHVRFGVAIRGIVLQNSVNFFG
jgi:hypothetical protein